VRWLATISLLGCGRNGFDTRPADSGLDDAVLDPSLVAHLTMDDDPSDGDLDDAVGTRRAVCWLGVTCGTSTAGRIGGALHLQDQQFYRLPHDTALAATGAFTIAVWARADIAAQAILVTKRYSLIYNTWGVDLDVAGNVEFEGAEMTTVVRSNFLQTFQQVSVAAWMHLALSYDGAQRRAYINGFRVASDAITLLADTQELLIGADEDDGTVFGHFTGDLDDLRIYDRKLDDAEISALAIP
jgi:hypothetical protein